MKIHKCEESNNALLNNQRVKKEITRKIRRYLKANKNENNIPKHI